MNEKKVCATCKRCIMVEDILFACENGLCANEDVIVSNLRAACPLWEADTEDRTRFVEWGGF